MRLNNVSFGAFARTLLAVEFGYFVLPRRSADPIRGRGADCVGIKGFVPGKRRHYAHARFARDAADRGFDEPGLTSRVCCGA